MPDWLLGVIGGFFVAVAGQYVSSFFKHWHFKKEKLIENYSQLAALLYEEFFKATTLMADLSILEEKGLLTDEKREQITNDAAEILSKRNTISKICFQIQILEPNQDLRELVQLISITMPRGYEPKELEAYQSKQYLHLGQLTELVRKRHASWQLGTDYPADWN